MNREERIMNRLQEHYDCIKDDYEVVGLFLQGSQIMAWIYILMNI